MKKIYLILFCLITIQASAQWTVVGTPFVAIARGLYFLSEDTGYAVGAGGYISKTMDGGVTWTAQTSGVITDLRSVYFLDSNTGWISGASGVVLKTTDGGVNWTSSNSGVGTSTCRAVSFTSNDVGFLAGPLGVIYETIDGGANWTTYTLDQSTSDVIQLQMVDANTGYAVCSVGLSPFANGYVYKTSDGGASWSQVYFDAAIGFLGLGILDASTVYVGGTNQTIVKTTDGGTTWSSSFVGLTGPTIRTGAAVTASNIFMGDDNGNIQNSNDEGASWSNIFYGGGLYSMNFPTTTIGYAGGGGGNVWKYDANVACTVAAPTDLFADVLTANKAVLSWTAPVGAVKYTVKYQTSGGTWKLTSNYNVHKVKDLSPDTKYVWSVRAYCGSPISGQSEWSANASFKTPALKVENSEFASSFEVYPNPVASTATINFTMNNEARVIADLFTIDGKKVMSIADQQFPLGDNVITMNRGSLSSGIYILQIKTNDDLLTKKIELQ